MYLLGDKSKSFYEEDGITSIINSSFSLLFIAIVGLTVSGEPLPIFPGHEFKMYFISMVFAITTNKLFENYLIKITNKVIYDKEIQLLRSINATSLESYQKLGHEKIINALIALPQIGQFPRLFVQILNASIICLCGIGYLAAASTLIGLFTFLFISIAILIYAINNKYTMIEVRRFRFVASGN